MASRKSRDRVGRKHRENIRPRIAPSDGRGGVAHTVLAGILSFVWDTKRAITSRAYDAIDDATTHGGPRPARVASWICNERFMSSVERKALKKQSPPLAQ
ncbi:hypothetical protein P3T76_003817 [Phytophthora citrophthora]|uniref:Uncharacterized protein n=1 Tax=Phytophthora citrophthora TaxID=4793 RepID=A0AAD9GUG8_9STRA|nr:hypothetical protein P3T76_003817 [Phytophthora citrophthora]